MLYEKEKQQPGCNGNKALNHSPEGYFHNLPHQGRVICRRSSQAVSVNVKAESCVHTEEKQGHEFRKCGAYRSSGNSQGWKTEFAENQGPVEEDIGQDHHDTVQGKR